MKERHVFKVATMLIAVLMGLAMVMSCSKDDDDGGGNNGSGSNSNYPSTPHYEKKLCSSCTGTGKCYSCKGSGLCYFCKGTGEIGTLLVSTCVVCKGNGVCKHCEGEGDCAECGGLGYKMVEVQPSNNNNTNNSSNDNSSTGKRCTLCGGTGTCSNVNDNQDHYCHGSGECGWCMDGIIYWAGTERVCEHCNGKNNCEYCHGSGKCSRCGGDGRM